MDNAEIEQIRDILNSMKHADHGDVGKKPSLRALAGEMGLTYFTLIRFTNGTVVPSVRVLTIIKNYLVMRSLVEVTCAKFFVGDVIGGDDPLQAAAASLGADRATLEAMLGAAAGRWQGAASIVPYTGKYPRLFQS